jgi:hypothetical protein
VRVRTGVVASIHGSLPARNPRECDHADVCAGVADESVRSEDRSFWADGLGRSDVASGRGPGAPRSRRVQDREGEFVVAGACVGAASRAFGPGREKRVLSIMEKG